jgi:hypothetical protein
LNSSHELDAQAMRANNDIALAQMGEDISFENIMKELRLREDLNAAVQRLLKQLMMIKGSKQAIGLERPARATEAPQDSTIIVDPH